jgi:hypothetical protein
MRRPSHAKVEMSTIKKPESQEQLMDDRLSDIDRKLDDMDNESQNDFKRYYGKQLYEIRT